MYIQRSVCQYITTCIYQTSTNYSSLTYNFTAITHQFLQTYSYQRDPTLRSQCGWRREGILNWTAANWSTWGATLSMLCFSITAVTAWLGAAASLLHFAKLPRFHSWPSCPTHFVASSAKFQSQLGIIFFFSFFYFSFFLA